MRYTFFFVILSALVLVGCSGPLNRVVSVTPDAGATGVAVDAQIEVVFRGEVEPHSLEGGFSLHSPDGTPIPGTVQLGADSRSASFRPDNHFEYGTQYTARVKASELRKGKGSPPRDFTYDWSFRTEPDPVVNVSVHSHQDGQKVFGSRSITLSGGLSSSSAITDVVIRHNGVELPGVEFRQTYFTVSGLDLRDNSENQIEVLATNEAGKQGLATLTLDYPYFRVQDAQEAAVVLGKYNSSWGNYSAGFGSDQFETGLRGSPAYFAGRLYLPDHNNHRILVHQSVPTTDGASADAVIGQPGFDQFPTSGTAAAELNKAASTVVADGRFFVADSANNRVLIWDAVPSGNEPASRVLGQSEFGQSTAACSRSGLRRPLGAFVVDGKLLVADSGNNRVLIWNEIPTASGQPADVVLGQANFENCAANDGNGDGSSDSASGSTLYAPSSLWSDGRRLYVADTGNNRVLAWDSFPVTSFEPAVAAVGQQDLFTTSSGLRAGALNAPEAITANGNQLFVADTANNRVLVWDSMPDRSGSDAAFVLGQGDFHCNIENSTSAEYGYCDYGFMNGISKRMLSSPAGLQLFPGGLLVADGGMDNNRYLVFEPLAQPW